MAELPTATGAGGIGIQATPVLSLGESYAESGVATVTDTLSSVAAGAETFPPIAGRWFNLTLRGTFAATAVVKRQFPGSEDWDVVSRDSAGTQATYTAPISLSLFEPKAGTIYRVDCTARTSGSIEVEWNQ